MPTYLIAPDSFKGCLSAIDFCTIAQKTILQKQPNATVLTRPLSDGGEGFVDAFIHAELAEKKSIWCANPLGRKIKAHFAWMPNTHTAIIEMAQASGLTRLRPDERNPLQTHTTGTGQLIQAAIELGAKKIILGLGGSATNDGGVGALKALGISFTTAQGKPVGLGGQALNTIHAIEKVPPPLLDIEWLLACDVTNPLLGEQGATRIFGPQKGLTQQSFPILETGLEHFAKKIKESTQKDIANLAGSGAAGGMAAGFIGLLNARIQPGFDVLDTHLNLTQLLKEQPIDYLITGEGKIDLQTTFGKLPQRIARLAKHYSPHCKTIGLCGHLEVSAQTLEALPEFDALFSLLPRPMDEYTAMRHTPEYLEQTLNSIVGLT